MNCFLSLKRTESAVLVNDLGRAKQLHFCIEKQKNSLNKKTVPYAEAIWNRIETREEQIEIEEMKKILDAGKGDTSILVFSFDFDKILNVWIINDKCTFIKLDPCVVESVYLIIELLERENVIVNRDSSFFKLDLAASSNNNSIVSPLEIPNKKVQPENAVENSANYGSLSIQYILEELFQILLKNCSKFVKGKKLIIVPDMHLFFVPFSALVDENGRYFCDTYSIQITPSMHSLKSSMQRSHESNCGFALFVGNPTVGKVSLGGKYFTPSVLPSATEEVKCLSKLFQATPLIGCAARKEVVLQLLSGATIVHIAAHGEPNKGEIMLAPNLYKKQRSVSVPEPEYYLLTQRDVANISLQARLVVLCCCHTGQGELSSEGVIGITRAFLAAGARSVLAALWPIDDNATKEFMEIFYGELCQETTVCEALRRTMNLFQKHKIEEYRSSRIWAPFTIYGEDVKFQKDEIDKIREKSREMFSGFVVLP